MADDYAQFDVGIVVFVRAWGVDIDDAADRAQAAISRAVRVPLTDDGPRGTGRDLQLTAVREIGHAAGAGYIRINTTGLPARNQGLPPL